MEQQDLQPNPFQPPSTVDAGEVPRSRFEETSGFGWLLVAVAGFMALALFLLLLFPELCQKIAERNSSLPPHVKFVWNCVSWVNGHVLYLLIPVLVLLSLNELIVRGAVKRNNRRLAGKALCATLTIFSAWIGWVLLTSIVA